MKKVKAICRECWERLGMEVELTPNWMSPITCALCKKHCEKQGRDFKVVWLEFPDETEA